MPRVSVHRRLNDAADAPGVPDDERVRGWITAAALALAGCEPARAYRSASQAVAAAHAADVVGALAVGLGQRAYAAVRSGLSTSEQVVLEVDPAPTELFHRFFDVVAVIPGFRRHMNKSPKRGRSCRSVHPDGESKWRNCLFVTDAGSA